MSRFVKPTRNENGTEAAGRTTVGASRAGIWVLVATILGSSMAFIDNSVVNVALPVLQVDLNATTTDVQWVMEAYSLFLASLILVGGSLGDHFGRRRIFAIGTLIFVAASIWCGFAQNILQLILARAVQGMGGALLVPGSLAIISASFPDEQRGRAIGTWSGFTAITTVIGPVLGGWLVQYASWRWVFFINVPLALVVLIVLFWRVQESRDESMKGGLDWRGALLTVVGLGGIVYGLTQAGSLGLGHPLVLISLAIGVIALVAFLLMEARIASPMVPLQLFASRTFSGANILTLFLYAALSGITFLLPFNLIQVQGYSATAAGSAFLPFILLMFALSRWTGGLVHRYGAKLPMTIGPILAAIGFALFAVPSVGGSYWTTFFPAIVVLGLGMSITVPPLTTAVMGAVDKSHAGVASGINNAVSRTAGLFSIAVIGIVILSIFNSSLDSHLALLNLPPDVRHAIDIQRVKLAGIQIPAHVNASVQAALKRAVDESFVMGFRVIALLFAVLALLGALTSWLLVDGKPAPRSNKEV